jgi:hypothetical protein
MNYKKIIPIVLSVMIGASSLAGARDWDGYKKAMKVLGESNPNMVEVMDGDYITSERLRPDLTVIAGIYAGTVKVKKTVTKAKGKTCVNYKSEGEYSQFRHPEAMLKALADADTNKDKIITAQEIRELEAKVLDDYSKPKSEQKKSQPEQKRK